MGNYSDAKNAPSRPQISFVMLLEDDYNVQAPDKQDEGFWPSLDKDSPGYVGENPEVPFKEQQKKAEIRMQRYIDGYWNFIGVRARATITLPIGGNAVITYYLKSAGVWGCESDTDERHLKELFNEQKDELLAHIKLMADCEVIE